MTVEPISDERLAEIRAGLDKYQWDLERLAGYGVIDRDDLKALLDKAEADAATARGLLSSLLNGDGPAVVPSPNPTA